MKNNLHIVDLETCLQTFGVEYPLLPNGNLSKDGQKAYDKLREVLSYMKHSGVVTGYNEDALDRLVSEPAY